VKLVPVNVYICTKCGYKLKAGDKKNWRMRKPGACPECGGVMRKAVVLR